MEKLSNQELLKKLQNKEESLTQKYLSIFQLKQNDSAESAQCLIEGFTFLSDSSLLQHEVTYALGQMNQSKNKQVIEFLKQTIENENNYVVVRHEAAEGLSNYAKEDCLREDLLQLFRRFISDSQMELRVTCELAIKKVETFETLGKKYGQKYSETKEPAAPFSLDEFQQIQGLNRGANYQDVIDFILDESKGIFEKYRCIYLLREIIEQQQSEEICLQLTSLLNQQYKEKVNGLLKHEICFVLGQVSQYGKKSENQLIETILDPNENEIVRHEAISAYSSISSNKEFLSKIFSDSNQIVRESAIVALDLIDYWN